MSIVVGYVPTPEGQAALEAAKRESQLRGAKLIVIASNRGGSMADSERIIEADSDIEKIQNELAGSGLDYQTHAYVRGNDPNEDLTTAAEDFDAELIVIGLRRRTAVGKLILGSIAQKVLLEAPCNVLAVHAK